jgi:hypothetical protein
MELCATNPSGIGAPSARFTVFSLLTGVVTLTLNALLVPG